MNVYDGVEEYRLLKFRAFFDGKFYYSDSQESGRELGARPGQSICGVFWSRFVGMGIIDQFTGLTDQDNREIYDGDIYEMFGQVHMIIAVYTHGLRFMWGDEQLTNAITKYGIYRGNVHENTGVLSK